MHRVLPGVTAAAEIGLLSCRERYVPPATASPQPGHRAAVHESPLSSVDWLRSEGERWRCVGALAGAPAGALLAVAVVAARLPAALAVLPIALLLLLAAVLHMHLLAASRLQLLRHNSADGHWRHHKAVWWLHLGGPLRPRR